MAPCDRCPNPSILLQRYSGAHLCGTHLRHAIERRAREEMGRQGDVPRGARLLVAYSGGKDSTVALHLATDLRDRRPDLEVVALTVDEGIAGYRPAALEIAARVTKGLGVEHIVRRTKDVGGLDVDEAKPEVGSGSRCGYCGVFRRRILNDVASELGATRVVTGHNLDDTAQSILMNLASANLERLAKLAPHDDPKPGFIPRMLPLRTVPESEVYLYALTRGLEWHDDECPYAIHSPRAVYRDVLHRLEEARPGTRHSLLRTHEALRPWLASRDDRPELRACATCGSPTSGDRCKACLMREQVMGAAPTQPE